MAFKLNRLEWLTIYLGAGLLALSAGLYFYSQTHANTQLGGDFTLRGAQGPVSLSDFRGRAVIFMFGYTSCPDVCPSGLANLAAGLDQLSPQQLEKVQPLFISVDPERDTPARLNEYSHYFHPNIIGLTDDKHQLDKVVKAYGAFYRRVDTPGSSMAYTVDHSARLYLIDGDGQLQALLYHNAPPSEITQALRSLL